MTDQFSSTRETEEIDGRESRDGARVIGRRLFLRRCALAGAGFAALPFAVSACAAGAGRAARAAAGESSPAAEALGWSARLTTDKEAGEPLVISGTIYAADGKTPLAGATLFVYHADARGLYSDTRGEPQAVARLRGRMLTGKDGRYEFRTIKAAAYPGRTIPAHIHASLTRPNVAERWLTDYWFDDDPLLPPRERERAAGLGTFSPVLKLTRGSDGVLRGVRDIRAE